ELEAQLDRLIDEASRRDVTETARDEVLEEADGSPPPSSEGAWEAAPDTQAEAAGASLQAAPLPVAAPSARHAVPEARPSGPLPSHVPEGEATVLDTARELLSTDFYLRKWGRLAMRNRSE